MRVKLWGIRLLILKPLLLLLHQIQHQPNLVILQPMPLRKPRRHNCKGGLMGKEGDQGGQQGRMGLRGFLNRRGKNSEAGLPFAGFFRLGQEQGKSQARMGQAGFEAHKQGILNRLFGLGKK